MSTRMKYPVNTGGIWVFLLILVLVAGGTIAAIFFTGKSAQEKLQLSLDAGYASIEKDRPEEALTHFAKASEQYGYSLTVFRKIRSSPAEKPYIQRSDLEQVMITAALMKAYQDLFKLQTADLWLQQAEGLVLKLTGKESEETIKLVKTAREVNKLVELIGEKKYEQVMKGILATEKRALATDQDFFILEVRLMIACGKALREPVIINHARELMFFLTNDAGLKDPKLNQLWGILSR